MKLNFFARIYLAITDFRLYPFIMQREKFINAFAYFTCFILLFSAILSLSFTSKIVKWLDDFVFVYDEKIEDFDVKNGKFTIYENMDFEYEGVRIYANDDLNFGELQENVFKESESVVTILVLKDSISVGNESMGFVVTKYEDLSLDINKSKTYDTLKNALDSLTFKLLLFAVVFASVFVAYLVTKFLNVIGITLMLLILGYVFGTSYKFREYMKVAFYVMTLPIIIELIALITTGTVSDYAYITYYLLMYVYMYYAIRALKLDNIIMATQEKMFEMREKTNEKATNKKVTENKEENKASETSKTGEEKNDENK